MQKLRKLNGLILVLAMAVALIPGVNLKGVMADESIPAAIGRHEAEDAISFTKGSASNEHSISENENYSGGKAVGGMNTWPDNGRAYCTTKVNATEAGKYIMTIGYAGGEANHPCNIDVRINEGDWISTTAPDTAWNVVGTISLEVKLVEGENTIDVTGACNVYYAGMSWEWVNIDYFELAKAPEEIPTAIGRHEAEDAQDLNGKTPKSGGYYESCSGNTIVSMNLKWINNTKDYIAWTVNAKEKGKYNLVLTYCSPKQAEMLIKVNNGTYEPFKEVAKVTGKVAPATGDWNVTGTVSTIINLEQGNNTIYISGPVMDNSTGDGNYFTVFEKNWNNGSSANFDCIDISKVSAIVDGVETEITNDKVTLGNAKYGYLCNGKMYKPGSTVDVEENMEFTSVNTLNIKMSNGAGIRYIGTPGLRFRTQIESDNMDFINSDSISEGTLITAKDIYDANSSEIDLTKEYKKINIENKGWYGSDGIYCGSICNIAESNYTRDFIARAYATINYTDGTGTTIYSNETPVRAVTTVAKAVKDAGYIGIDEQYYNVIDSFIQ